MHSSAAFYLFKKKKTDKKQPNRSRVSQWGKLCLTDFLFWKYKLVYFFPTFSDQYIINEINKQKPSKYQNSKQQEMLSTVYIPLFKYLLFRASWKLYPRLLFSFEFLWSKTLKKAESKFSNDSLLHSKCSCNLSTLTKKFPNLCISSS